MWNLVASLIAMALFAIVALMVDTHATQAIEQAALTRAQAQSALLLAQFATAAHNDAIAKGYGQGTAITVQTLIADGALPSGFPPTDALGLTFQARVGNVSGTAVPLVAWTSGMPTQLFGLPVNSQTLASVELQVAQNAAAAQQNSGAMVGVADTSPPGGAPPYTALRMPLSLAGLPVTSMVPSFSVSTPAALVLYSH